MKKVVSQWALRAVLGLLVLPALRFAVTPEVTDQLLHATQRNDSQNDESHTAMGQILSIQVSDELQSAIPEQQVEYDVTSSESVAGPRTAVPQGIHGARVDEVEGHEILITPAGGTGSKAVKFDLKKSSKTNCPPKGG